MSSTARPGPWLALLVLAAACSGQVGSPSADAGAAGSLALAGQSSGGSSNGSAAHGGAGAATGGAAGMPPASAGEGGTPASAGTAGSGGGAGTPVVSASATFVSLQGSGVSGSALFTPMGDHVQLTLRLGGCAQGAHAVHLHANPACGDDGNAAGGHWLPQGEGIPDLMCGADGNAELVFEAAPGLWSIGAPLASDVLGHAVMLHQGPSQDPGARIACGISAKVP